MVGSVQAVFLLLLVFVAVFAGLARPLKVPYPILARNCRAAIELSSRDAADRARSQFSVFGVPASAPVLGGVDPVVEGVPKELCQHCDACGGVGVVHGTGAGDGSGFMVAGI
jgi:hypothetical protein